MHPDVSFGNHSFGEDNGAFGYFLRDAAYIYLALTTLSISICKSEFVKFGLAKIFLVNILWEYVKLVMWNNEYDPISMVTGCFLMLCSIVYLRYLWKHDHEAG